MSWSIVDGAERVVARMMLAVGEIFRTSRRDVWREELGAKAVESTVLEIAAESIFDRKDTNPK